MTEAVRDKIILDRERTKSSRMFIPLRSVLYVRRFASAHYGWALNRVVKRCPKA